VDAVDKIKSMRFILFALLVATLCYGCDVHTPVTHLTEEEIIGTWVITEESKLFLEKKEFCCTDKPTQLILFEDHKFQLKDIQDCWVVDSRKCKGTLNLHGTWRLSNLPNTDVELLLNDGEGTRVVFIGKNSKGYALLFGFGDGDSGNSILLTKQEVDN